MLKYGDTLRIHRDTYPHTQDETFTLEIPEYSFRRTGYATETDAFDAALEEVERREGLTHQETLSKIAKLVNGIEYQKQRLEDLKKQLINQRAIIQSREAELAMLETDLTSSNDLVEDGDPSQLPDDAPGIRPRLSYWFRHRAFRIGTIGLRWPWKDADGDGKPDHGIVVYPKRRKNMDFESE